MNCKDIFYKGSSIILICLQIFTTYVGFVAFFYVSIQIIFSYPLSLISNCLSKDWFSFISNFFWLFISVPYIHLLVVLNIKIITSYFKNIWKALDLQKAENRLRQFFQNPKWCSKENRIDRWGFIYLFSVFMNLIFLIIEITTTSEQTVCSLAFAGLSCYPPLFGCIYVIFKSIPICKLKMDEQSSIFSEDEILSQSFIDEKDTTHTEQSIENENIDQPLNEVEENDINQVEKWQVYFDPCQIIIQDEFIDFIKDSNVNDYKYLLYNHKIIPSFIITAIFIEYIIHLIYNFVVIDRTRDYLDIIFFVTRIVYSLISFRFLIIFNCANFLINFIKIKEKHKFIWFTYLAAITISIVCLIAVGIILIIVFKVFAPFQLKEFHYSPFYKNVTFSSQSSVCQTKFYDLSLVEYAGIASFGQSKNKEIANEIMKMVFNNNRTFSISTIDNPISYMYTIKLNETFSIRAFESLTDKTSVSFMLDLFMNDFVINRMSYGTIPFYYVTIEFFLFRYLHFLTMIMNRYLLMNLIYNFAYFANNLFTVYDKMNFENSTIIYVGHSIGGLIAKAIGSKRNVPSVAFESLEYYRSLFHMTINSDSVNFSSDKLKIFNIFSPSQIFSEIEQTSMINVNLPKWKGIYQFANAYDTFCMVAAGCATDARYDQFCNAVIGRNSFLNLFKLWNRSRSDDL